MQVGNLAAAPATLGPLVLVVWVVRLVLAVLAVQGSAGICRGFGCFGGAGGSNGGDAGMAVTEGAVVTAVQGGQGRGEWGQRWLRGWQQWHCRRRRRQQ